MNQAFKAGGIIGIRDHINLLPESPLRGPHDARLGLRFPDMSEPYCERCLKVLQKIASINNIEFHTGVYAALPGPSLETRAEYAYLNKIGADLVAMSIIPEVIVAVQEQLQVAGLAVVSNICYPPEDITPTTIEEVIDVVNGASGNVATLIAGLIEELASKEGT